MFPIPFIAEKIIQKFISLIFLLFFIYKLSCLSTAVFLVADHYTHLSLTLISTAIKAIRDCNSQLPHKIMTLKGQENTLATVPHVIPFSSYLTFQKS